jgi:hypothetical protein
MAMHEAEATEEPKGTALRGSRRRNDKEIKIFPVVKGETRKDGE